MTRPFPCQRVAAGAQSRMKGSSDMSLSSSHARFLCLSALSALHGHYCAYRKFALSAFLPALALDSLSFSIPPSKAPRANLICTHLS